jgi:hypothetical protein
MVRETAGESSSHHLAGRGVPDLTGAVQSLTIRETAGVLRSTLEKMATGRKTALSGIVGYSHPNGFDKIALGVDGQDRRLFLHVWKNNWHDTHIHNHRWNFASTIVRGEVVNRGYSIVEISAIDAPTEDLFKIHNYSPSGYDYSIRPSDRDVVSAIELEVDIIAKGASYSQSARVFHAASASRGTATLVARGPHHWRTAEILVPRHAMVTLDERFRPLQQATIVGHIESVLADAETNQYPQNAILTC